LSPEDHVLVQGVIQKYVDASISKTVNAPKTHTVEDVKRLYTLAYKVGCKGIAYMREGSRAGVLERVDDKKKDESATPAIKPAPAIQRRPSVMFGLTYKTQTPLGDAFITLNNDEHDNPFEAFITIGKSGSDVAAMADALGRMISLILRIQSPVASRERIRQIVAQLSGIGGVRTVGFGPKQVRSVPDAVAKVLAEQFGFSVNGVVKDLQKSQIMNAPLPNGTNGQAALPNGTNGNGQMNGASQPLTNGHANGAALPNGQAAGAAVQAGGNIQVNVATQISTPGQSTVVMEQLSISEPTHNAFDLCPSCGGATLAHEEGCKKCYSCGYSEC
jgi:ribonucleoside-diphosphate reductase alpha chain